MQHRADIDGLRAVAVLAVLLFHAGIPGFAGGFVGVDVFFVISGFLITRLIAEPILAGRFSLLRFFDQRARRLLPALVVLLLACLAAGALLQLPDVYADFGESLLAALGFVSNLHFAADTGYFAAEATSKPLLHTWSLGVEAQFYLVFPPVLMAAALLGGRRLMLAAVLLLLAVSLGLSVALTPGQGERAFYLGHLRAWELMVGAVVALLPDLATGSRRWRNALAALGLTAIVAAVLLYDPGVTFPGFAALLPCAGAALLVLAGGGPATSGINTLLARRLPVTLGLMSYSLYLWHWPILVYAEQWLGRPLSAGMGLLALALALPVAALSWRWVEQPFRRAPAARRPRLRASLALAALTSAGVALLVVASDGLPWRLPPAARSFLAAKSEKSPLLEGCFRRVPGDDPPPCGLGSDEGPVRLLLWGDSHGAALGSALDALAGEAGLKGIALLDSSCPPAVGVLRVGVAPQHDCAAFGERVLDYLAVSDFRVAILHARWPLYVEGTRLSSERGGPVRLAGPDNAAAVEEGLDRLLARLGERGIAVILIAGVPEIGFDVPATLARSVLQGGPSVPAPARAAIDARQDRSWTLLRALANRHGALLLDPRDALCDAAACRIEQDGQALYFDDDHLSLAGAAALLESLAPAAELLRGLAPPQ